MAQGYKDFTAGAVLTAADLEDYNQNQSIMRFANAAARDTALSTVKTEGMTCFLLDVNAYSVYSGSAWSTVGPAHGAFTSWTPAVTQSVSVTVTNTASTYIRLGRLIIAWFNLAVTGSGTAANAVTISLPITAAGSTVQTHVGNGHIYDASATFKYYGMMVINSTTTAKWASSTGTSDTFLGANSFTAGLANTDQLGGFLMYEAAGDA